MSDVLTRREVARRLNRSVDYAIGAIESRGLPSFPVGKAQCITLESFRQIEHLRRPKRARAAS